MSYKSDYEKFDKRTIAVIDEIESVLVKHKFMLSHEDGHGRFILSLVEEKEAGINGYFFEELEGV
jgi:hypothetical protein